MIKSVLFLNSLTCLLFGISSFLFSEIIVNFLGFTLSPTIIQIVGLILILFAVHILIAVNRKAILLNEIIYFSIGDLSWVLGTVLLLVFTNVIPTQKGVIAAILVAIMVGIFATLQLKFVRSKAIKRT